MIVQSDRLSEGVGQEIGGSLYPLTVIVDNAGVDTAEGKGVP